MCFRNGSRTFKSAPDRRYANLRVHQMGHPSGTVSASKCATHLEPFLLPNVYPIWNASRRIMSTQNHHPRDATNDAFTRQIASVTRFFRHLHPSPHVAPPCSKCVTHLEYKTVPNVLLIWSTKRFQICFRNGSTTFKSAPDRRYANLRVHQMGHPFGTVSASKCVTPLEPFLP